MRTFITLLISLTFAAARLPAQTPQITGQPSDCVAPVGGVAAFGVSVSGAGPFTYQWQFDGTNLPDNIISTVAGGGAGMIGGPATNFVLMHPSDVVTAPSGILFITDPGANLICKVDANGVVTIVAGNGSAGYSGDGGAATNASVNDPIGIALDASGNIFFADAFNNCIRKVAANGIITTVAGNGIGAYSGDGGAATNASLSHPVGVALDAAGNLFIADTGNSRFRKVSASGIITTVAGNGISGDSGDGGAATNATFSGEAGAVTVDAAGNLFISDYLANRVRKVNTAGVISTFAGNGTAGYTGDGRAATNANLYHPEGLSVDTAGNLFIADRANNVIRKVDTNGIITTVAGNGSAAYSGDGAAATNASLNQPTWMTVTPAGDMFIADCDNNYIRKVDANGIITTVAGRPSLPYFGDGGLATEANLNGPFDVVVDPLGDLFIADSGNFRIRKVNTAGIINTVAGNGTNGISADGGAAVNASLINLGGISVDVSGDLFMTDFNRIRKVDTNGIITTVAGTGRNGYFGDGGAATNALLYDPTDVRADGHGNLFIADSGNSSVRKVSSDGIITTVAGKGVRGYSGDGGAATNATLGLANAVTVDALGDIFIADSYNHRIRKVDTNGIITTVAGNGVIGFTGDGGPATNARMGQPYRVGVDTVGNFFIADHDNDRIRRVDTNGIITTFAGTDAPLTGDGGAATNASLMEPTAVVPDAFGNVFIADSGNNRIRKVTNTQGPILSLNNVTADNAGSYRVVVAGPSGSVTSHVAVLNLLAPGTGALQVTISPNAAIDAGARWRVDGGAYNQSGATVPNLSAGNHTIAFDAIVGWSSPPDQTIAIEAGTTSMISAAYTLASAGERARLVVITNGIGGVSPNDNGKLLQIGAIYGLTASLGRNQLFSNWVGGTSPPYSVLTSSPGLRFVMQSNLVLQANFVTNIFLAAQGSYNGLFAPSDSPRTQDDSGAFTFRLASSGEFSGKLLLASCVEPLNGQFDLNGSARVHSPWHERDRFQTTLQLDLASQAVTGTVSNRIFAAQLLGYRQPFSSSHKAANYAGRYTMVIEGTNNAGAGPYGSSFATVIVDPLGNLTLTGSLADGTAISQSSSISEDGYWPMYVPLYRGAGSIWSWNYFTNKSIVSASLASWIKTATWPKSGLYSAGFTNQQADIIGSFYASSLAPLLNFTNGQAILEGGNLPSPLSIPITMSRNDAIVVTDASENANKLSLKINRATGRISGSFLDSIHPAHSVKINGVLLQNQNVASGYFTGTNQSGAFLLQPD